MKKFIRNRRHIVMVCLEYLWQRFTALVSIRGNETRYNMHLAGDPFKLYASRTTEYSAIEHLTQRNLMKAFILESNGIENLLLKNIEVPEIGENEVLVKTKAISLNPADIACLTQEIVRSRLYKPIGGEALVPGWDVAGEIVGTGHAVTGLKAGDRVFGCLNFPGRGKGFAEFVAAPAEQLALIPPEISFEIAAASCMSALTAFQALVAYGKISKNDKVLIHAAAGGVGHIAVQIAKSFGAYVIGTAATENVGFVKSIGADQVIDYKKDRFEETARHMDLVLDSIDTGNLIRSLDTVKNGGRVISLKGHFEGEAQEKARLKNVTGIRITVGSDGEDMKEIATLLASGKVRPVIDRRFRFSDLPAAAASFGKTTRGKLVINLD